MNKKALLILLVSISTIASGCSEQKSQAVKTPVASNAQTKAESTVKPTTTTTETKPSNSQSSNSTTNSTKNDNLQSSTSINYRLAKNVYTNKNVTVNYPQITNFGDKNKQKLINNILKGEALKVLNYYKDSEGDVTSNINYTIKFEGKDRLSVQYSGTAYAKGAAHPNNIFYTTNIDLNKGVKLRLFDIVKIDENFVSRFKSSADKAKEPAKSSLEQYTTADLIKMFKNADSLDNIGTVNQSDTFSYFTKDALGISVSVSHAAGDHVEIEMKY